MRFPRTSTEVDAAHNITSLNEFCWFLKLENTRLDTHQRVHVLAVNLAQTDSKAAFTQVGLSGRLEAWRVGVRKMTLHNNNHLRKRPRGFLRSSHEKKWYWRPPHMADLSMVWHVINLFANFVLRRKILSCLKDVLRAVPLPTFQKKKNCKHGIHFANF